MSEGKAIAQAGHAYTETLIEALSVDPEAAEAYCLRRPNTKIALDGGCEANLLKLRDRLVERGIPCFLVIDQDHVELPDFDGSPTVSALGVGPITRDVARKHLRFPLWAGKGGGS